MRYLFLLLPMVWFSFRSGGQTLSETQLLLREHPAPPWFKDAKLGIFIHWGPYSVPAWSPKGVYAEWYQYWLENKNVFGQGTYRGSEVAEFHTKRYGLSMSYYDLASQFKVELFDAKSWAKIFADAGAQYVVLTSKHHDGYTLWPSTQAGDRGFPWNATAVGPGRDLVGELGNAVRQAGLKYGLYYSLYEWFHPWWLADKPKYVREHLHPQLKDLVTRYSPDILWMDGDWDLTPEEWGSAQLLKWLYEESPVKNSLITNDRWGKGTMKNFGGFLTSEYESSASSDQYWEECRGLGHSFGYNREEDIADYMTDKAVVLTLIDVVSQGGNLLLNIGPSADGKIPVIMQQRLQYLGDWLRTHGEAIYGTRPWSQAVQWSNGTPSTTPGKKKGPNYILQETSPNAQGTSYKEVFFTAKHQTLYAIFPSLPEGKYVIKNFPEVENLSAQLLHNKQNITLKKHGHNDLELNLSNIKSNDLVVVKISYTTPPPGKPSIVVEIDTVNQRAKVTLEAKDSTAMLFYTLDNSEPNEKSKLYKRPFWTSIPITVKATSFRHLQFSPMITKLISLTPAREEEKVVAPEPALPVKPDHTLTLETKPQSSSNNAILTLMDRTMAKPLLTDPQWVNYMQEDAELMVDLGELRKIRGVRFSFLHQPNMGIFAPSQVNVEISDNEWDFTPKKTNPVQEPPSAGVHQYSTQIYNTIGRYVFIRIRYFKTCPVHHPKAGQPAKLLIDELMID